MGTVLQVAYPFAPVSVDAVGGAEQIVATLDRAITARGHRSLIVACAGSKVHGTLFEVPSVGGLIDARAKEATYDAVRTAIACALATHVVDVVHFHGIDFGAYFASGVRSVVTLHLPISWYPPSAFAIPATFVCVSESQRRDCPIPVAVVENGVDLAAFRTRRRTCGFALALGRICPEKGFERAIDAAAAAGVSLLLAGQAFGYEAHLHYFETVLAPRLKRPHRWLGPIGRDRKRRLLAGARCVLIPSLAAETSSLVAMEALASGTPVVGHPVGALTDIVEHGRTGFLVDSVDEMAGAIRRVGELTWESCRTAAQARFSADRMVEKYLSIYDLQNRRTGRRERTRNSVEVIDSPSALEALTSAWTELWNRVSGATPFQRPEWLLPWCRHLRRAPLHCEILFQGGRLVGVLPFVADEFGWDLAGTGISDYLDILVEPAAESFAVSALEAMFGRLVRGCAIGNLPRQSLLARARIESATPVERDLPCPVLPLDRARPIQRGLPPRFARRLAYARRRATREGLELEDVQEATLQEFLDALFALHRARWVGRGEPGVLADLSIERFHRETAAKLFTAGLLAMHGLREPGGRLVAVSYGFLTRERGFLYLGGFDPAYAARSPGAVVIGRAIEQAHVAGACTFDFLRGAEDYKYEWGARDEWTMRRVFREWKELACADR
jgi:CelD/BcsL family acetyltransferase involved in cellulose biosynthesis/glycosyltransferase involved in cell wall biosynthesis